MPVTAILNLRAATSGPVARSFHCLMHPVFLDRISQTDAAMGKTLHDSSAVPPFSLSPVLGIRDHVRENRSCRVRFGILSDDLADIFVQSMEKGLWQEPIRLENHVFEVEHIVLGEDSRESWSGQSTFQEIMIRAGLDRRVSVNFVSPVSFKRGDVHYPLPDPVLIFGSLARRWNAFAPFHIPEDMDFSNIGFSHINIRTEPYSLRKGGTVNGFTGNAVFVFKTGEETVFCCRALLEFAFYSGIGVKTTQGMGMCRVHLQRDE